MSSKFMVAGASDFVRIERIGSKAEMLSSYAKSRGEIARRVGLGIMTLALAACGVTSKLPLASAPSPEFPIESASAAPTPYLIGPMDTLNVAVFREPQLSAANLQVDSGGDIVLPLVGKLRAAGKTAADLSSEIEQGFKRYLINPSVAVNVNSVRQTIVVEGSVNQPGIYPIPGRTSLLGAMALARSPNDIAANDQVLIFRNIDGRLAAARFDINRVRMGLDPDPAVLAGDRVVVGFSGLKQGWRDFLSKGIFNAFRFGLTVN